MDKYGGEIVETRAATAAQPPGFTARLIPYGEVATLKDGRLERFAPGALQLPPGETVPLMLDHGGGVLERIGLLTVFENRGDGAYGDFVVSDTAAGRDAMTLLRDGVLGNVSVGFRPSAQATDRAGVIVRQSAVLDHVAIVAKGAYQGAKAVAVRSAAEQEQKAMTETNPAQQPQQSTETPAAPAQPVEERVAQQPVEERVAQQPVAVSVAAPTVTEDRVRQLEALVATLQAGGPLQERSRRNPSLGRAIELVIASQRNKLDSDDEVELRALAVDSTTTAAGLVPDFYSSEVISIVDTARPFVASLDTDPIGDHGMDVIYPEVTQKPAVAKQATQGTEVASQQFTIAPKTVSIDTFAGANTVNVQVIDRSSPAFLDAFYRELAGIYAQETEQEAETVVLGASGIGTSVLADFSADAAATVSALVAATVGIAKAVKRMPEELWVSPDRWGQLAELVDSTGRPLFPWVGNGPANAIGETNLASMAGQVSNLRLKMVPNFADDSALLGWPSFAASLEQAPLRVQAIQVATLQWELGVYGYFATAVKHAGGVHSFTTS